MLPISFVNHSLSEELNFFFFAVNHLLILILLDIFAVILMKDIGWYLCMCVNFVAFRIRITLI